MIKKILLSHEWSIIIEYKVPFVCVCVRVCDVPLLMPKCMPIPFLFFDGKDLSL